MTHFKHLLTLLLAVTCLQMSARALPNDDGTTSTITFMSGTTTLSNNQKVPNGTLIQLQASNFPEDAAFSYLIGTTAATADDFSKAETAQKGFINDGTPLAYQHGIPVFASYNPSTSSTSLHRIVLSVQVSKPETVKNDKGKVTTTYSPYEGYSDNIYTLTLYIDGTTKAVAPPTIAPETHKEGVQDNKPNTILTLSESSVTTGDPGNTVFAKYSSSKKYTALQLMAEPNLQLGEHGAGTIGIFSTITAPARRTTALQVKHNVSYGGNTYDVASDVTVVYYWYTTDRKKAVIKADPEKIETTAEEIKGKAQQINVSFYDANDQTKALDISTLIDYQSKKSVSYRYICNNPEIATVDENGLVTFTGKAGRAYITIFTNKVNMFGKDEEGNLDDKKNIGYDAAVTTVSLTVTDPVQMMPPIINPDGKKYFKDLKVTVTANTSKMTPQGKAYYVVVDKGTDTPKPEYIVEHGTEVAIDNVGVETLNKRNATVYAVSYNPDLTNNQYSAISTETFEYVDLQDPVLTPGNKGGIYWFIGDENTELSVVASTATPNASVYYTINQEGDINDISLSGVQLYSGNNKIKVKSGYVVRAVTYLDGVYSNTVTYTYNKQDGGSWSSYSSTSDRVFRNDIQAYIITGYDKNNNAFIAKSIDVGATGQHYLPALTGVLLYSTTLTQAQLLNYGIDGKGISMKGKGGRTQPAVLTGNLLIAADDKYQEHISTYDDNGDINMAFNRWSTCVTYDGGKDYYGFFSFYEDNTRQNKNNWRHTAYLKLKKGSPERINFEDYVEQGAKITIVDDEPTAIQTV
ncbi:MAG: hypothetical protein SO442_11675, partial [Prevotella sp.]|nr:hypothetical protein [Prevotella sp.]